jgi:D-beta-D-heptose 7-phosphate kinase/D-beta-D-heptose 1-phosphate adenosyltransferase
VLVEGERHALGGAANVAGNVTALGAVCVVVGCVGDDAEADVLLAELGRAGVDRSGVVRVAGRPTTLKTRVHAKPHQIVRLDREVDTDVAPAEARTLAEAVRVAAAESHAIIIQDYDKGVLTGEVITATMAAAKDRGVPVVVDPKRRSFLAYGGATVFKPNKRELEDALGERVRADDPEWMEVTRERIGCAHLLVTLSDRGMTLHSADHGLVRLDAFASEVFDVSGAGDTVSATVAVALAAGATVPEAAALANHAAAVEVQRPGVRTVSPDEITAHVRTWPT